MNPVSSASSSVCKTLLAGTFCAAMAGWVWYSRQNPLSQAETIFKNLDNSSVKDKEELVNHLNRAYRDLRKSCFIQATFDTPPFRFAIPYRLRATAERIFFIYGRTVYGGNMEASRQMFQLSLALQCDRLRALSILAFPFQDAEGTDELDDLESLAKKLDESSSKELDSLLMKTNIDTLAKIAFSTGTGDISTASHFATTVRWLGATYQNIDRYNAPEHAERFERIYGLARQIFSQIDDADSRWEVGQIIYNTGRFIHYLSHPNDVEGALATLNGLDKYIAAENGSLRSRVLQAQIHNITMIELSKKTYTELSQKQDALKRQYDHVVAASQIANETEGFNLFLKTMFLSNRARIATDCLETSAFVASAKEIGEMYSQVLKTIETEQYNHFYHSSYILGAAKFQMIAGNLPEARRLHALAATVIARYPASSAELQQRHQELAKRLAGATPT